MMLQSFVTSVIEAIGGAIEPIEYALCEVLIPEDYKEVFQGKAEMLLAFDFEVAEENPSAEFVTFGSFVLDKLIELVNEKTISTVRYIIMDHLKVASPEEKLKKFLNIDRGSLKIENEQKVMGSFAAFHFSIGFSTDERIEEHKEVWIDLTTSQIAQEMFQNKNSIFHEKEISKSYSCVRSLSVMDAFGKAYAWTKQAIEIEKTKYQVDSALNNEVKRIQEYYGELKKENDKKTQRKGITEEKISELKSKEEILDLECQRQLKEMHEKYTVRTDIGLENGAIYFMPLIEYKIKVTIDKVLKEKTVYYNGITRNFQCLNEAGGIY